MEKKRNLLIGWLVTAMVVVLLIIDQWIKLYIKTHFCLGESVRVTDWFFIDFIENNGMAWGMSFIGKFWLSLLRSVAIVALIVYLYRIIKRGYASSALHHPRCSGTYGCHRQYDRFDVLWSGVHSILALLRILYGTVRRWICAFLYG